MEEEEDLGGGGWISTFHRKGSTKSEHVCMDHGCFCSDKKYVTKTYVPINACQKKDVSQWETKGLPKHSVGARKKGM